jgi:hypothetical protein
MGEQALNPASWRGFAHRPGGVLIALLLVLLLAFDGHACSMWMHGDPDPPSKVHDCCPEQLATADQPENLSPTSCHDGACLQAAGHHDATDRRGPSASNPDLLSPPLAATPLPPDWLGSVHRPPILTIEITGPPPPQRSRVLRL